ncbi:MAG: precorrin-2 dehydrogenase/sirohydrochlorin ferrochelatase family protein [Candidatus Adiutrix sp.]
MLSIELCLENRQVLLVGAGKVGLRKLQKLLKAQAQVTVVDRQPSEQIQDLAQKGQIVHCFTFDVNMLNGISLVFIASSDSALNQEVHLAAKAKGLWVNIADSPQASDFLLPATVERGPLRLTVSTKGASPALAALLAKRLKQEFGPEYGQLTEILGQLRPEILKQIPKDIRPQAFHSLATSKELLAACGQGELSQIELIVNNLLGPFGFHPS